MSATESIRYWALRSQGLDHGAAVATMQRKPEPERITPAQGGGHRSPKRFHQRYRVQAQFG